MYRDKILEIIKDKGISLKALSEMSGVSVDTLTRVTHPENPEKDSPRVSTLQKVCEPLDIELWELFYIGDKSFVALNAELAMLKSERDALVAQNAILEEMTKTQQFKIDSLKDQIIDTHNYYIKQKEK
jgi:transcriptional regulator with XRE-family HTH domain